MSNLLPSEKLEEQLPKLLPGVLALYRKHAETCHVSKVRPSTPWPCRALSTDGSPRGSSGGCRPLGRVTPRVLLDSVLGGAWSYFSWLPCPAWWSFTWAFTSSVLPVLRLALSS